CVRHPLWSARRRNPGRGRGINCHGPPGGCAALVSRAIGISLGVAGLLSVPLASEMRIMRAAQPMTDAWKLVEIEPRGATLLGLSYRPRQAEALGMDVQRTLQRLL